MNFLIYLPQILLLVSLLGIFLITFRKIPTLMKFPRQPEIVLAPQPIFKRLFQFRISRIFIILINWIEKGLRKLRILFLRIDNFIGQWIQRAREKSQILTIRYQAWLAQRKMWRIKIKHKTQGPEIKQESAVRDFKAEACPNDRNYSVGREQAYIKLLAQDPKNAEIYRKLGNLYLEQKNYQDARQAFEQILKLRPQDKRAMAKLEKIKKNTAESRQSRGNSMAE